DWGWRLSLSGHRVICTPTLIPVDEGVRPPGGSPLEGEGARVSAGVALLASMLEEDSLHRALAQNPAAATALFAGEGRLGESDLRDRRAATQSMRRCGDAALALEL